jgi:iron complex outermembrane receptor protein
MDEGSGASSLRLAIRAALATGAGFGLIATDTAIAQSDSGDQATDDVAVQQKITVTGSRIKRLDFEGPLPVTVIDREAIDTSGDLTVADVVRRTTYNTFGSFRQRSGSLAQGVNTVNLRGLGDQNTLVLINGRRMAGAPAFSGAVQNLSLVPLAAVDRIEILRDGASAIYGTDAIAGVVNIILRKDYEGVHLSANIARPSQSGGDEEAYSIVGGVTGTKGNVTFALSKQERDIVFDADRSFTAERINAFGFPGSYFAYLSTEDPRNPTGRFLSLGTFPDPRCPDELNTDPDFPNSRLFSYQTPDGEPLRGQGLCEYNYASAGAREAGNDTKSFFVSANYEIAESASFFAQGTFSYNESFGQYAPAPVVWFPWSRDAPNNPTNPDNPTNADGLPYPGQQISVDTDDDDVPDLTVTGPFDLEFAYRNVPGGPRDMHYDDTLLHYVAGVEGAANWLGGTDWQLAAQYSEQSSNGVVHRVRLDSAVNSVVANGELDVFGVTDSSLANIEEQAGSISRTLTYGPRFRIAGADGQLAFDAFQLDPGPVSVAIGFEYRDEDWDEAIDEQTLTETQSVPLSGARVVQSVFAEGVIPVLDSLEFNLATRYDDYNDFGTTLNSKASLAFRPVDSLLLRASWGQGFQAPALSDLYASTAEYRFFGVIDTWRCAQTPEDTDGDGRANVPMEELPRIHPCSSLEGQNSFTAVEGGNRDLDPIESTQWGLGLVWSPLDSLTLGLDYYNIEVDNEVALLSYQLKLDEEFRLREAGESGTRVGDVTRSLGGRLQEVENHLVNVASRDTEGIDLDAHWLLRLGRYGDLSTRLYWTRVLNFSVSDTSDPGRTVHRDGDVFYPEDRGQLTLNWSLGDFNVTTVGNYISDQEGAPNCGPEDRCRLGVFTTVDLQASWATPWNGQITVGARNIFDEDPPTDFGFYTNQQHEVFGRVPYVRWEQDL